MCVSHASQYIFMEHNACVLLGYCTVCQQDTVGQKAQLIARLITAGGLVGDERKAAAKAAHEAQQIAHQQLALSEDLQRERQELFERQRVAGLQQQAELHAQQRVLHEARLHEQRQQEAALLLAQQMQPTNESTKSQAWS
jgi:hypothetical protein